MTDTDLYTALAGANTELTNPSKDGAANYGQYATLAGTLDHVRPVLAKHGLFVTQDVANDDTHLYIRTTIAHKSGQTIGFGPIAWPMVDKIQTLGGLVTYCRRYALMAALGLSGADDDDDGQDANQSASRTGTTVKTPPGLKGPAAGAYAKDVSAACTPKQIGMVHRLMKAHGLTEADLPDRVGITTPVEGLEKMTKHEASRLIDELSALDGSRPVVRFTPAPGRDYTPEGSRDGSPPYDGPADPWVITDPETGEQVTAR